MADMLPQGYDDTNHFWDEGEVPAVSGTVEVGDVVAYTRNAGDPAEVAINNVGSDTAAKLNFIFGIPRGEDGEGRPGSDGVSPIVTVTDITGGHRITITDAIDTQSFDVIDGRDGITPVISASASVDNNTGTPEVTVTRTGTTESPSFVFAFKNIKGRDGTDAISPTITVTDITGGHRVTITDADGTRHFDVTNGTNGVTPIISATATVGTGTSSPSCTVTKTGTDEAPSFNFAFDGIKGADGQSSAYTQSRTYDLTFNPPAMGSQSYNFSANDFTVADLAAAKMMILSIFEEDIFHIAIPMPQDSTKTTLVRNIFSNFDHIVLRDADGHDIMYYPSAGGTSLSFYVLNSRSSSPYVDIKVSIFT